MMSRKGVSTTDAARFEYHNKGDLSISCRVQGGRIYNELTPVTFDVFLSEVYKFTIRIPIDTSSSTLPLFFVAVRMLEETLHTPIGATPSPCESNSTAPPSSAVCSGMMAEYYQQYKIFDDMGEITVMWTPAGQPAAECYLEFRLFTPSDSGMSNPTYHFRTNTFRLRNKSTTPCDQTVIRELLNSRKKAKGSKQTSIKSQTSTRSQTTAKSQSMTSNSKKERPSMPISFTVSTPRTSLRSASPSRVEQSPGHTSFSGERLADWGSDQRAKSFSGSLYYPPALQNALQNLPAAKENESSAAGSFSKDHSFSSHVFDEFLFDDNFSL